MEMGLKLLIALAVIALLSSIAAVIRDIVNTEDSKEEPGHRPEEIDIYQSTQGDEWNTDGDEDE